MKTTKLLLASMIAATAIFAAPYCDKGAGNCEPKGQSKMGGKSGNMDKGMMFGTPMSLKTLKLTKEQEDKIAELNKDFRAEMAKLHIGQKSINKDPFVAKEGFSKEAFKKEANDRMQKVLDLRAEHLAKIYAVLTTEQQKSLSALAK